MLTKAIAVRGVLLLLTLSALAAIPCAILYVIGSTVGLFYSQYSRANLLFLSLFYARYLRLVVGCVANFLYRPAMTRRNPTFTAQDCTVVLPTVDPDRNPDIVECITTICMNKPKALYIVTVGDLPQWLIYRYLWQIRYKFPDVSIEVLRGQQRNKRSQISAAMPRVKTPITVLVDDHVFLPPRFLPATLAAFEDEDVYLAGTAKTVRLIASSTDPTVWWPRDFIFNMIGALYLERHNWEARASTFIDGGVFAISGRASAIRTDFFKSIQRDYLSETYDGKELIPDDDNFLTRSVFFAGKKVSFQSSADTKIVTTLGQWPRFRCQCLRWARTTFRSNPLMLRDFRIWFWQPFSIYSVYLSGLCNFAVVWDSLLLLMFMPTSYNRNNRSPLLFLCWILAAKCVKIWPFFARHPREWFFGLCYVPFAYYHSWIKAEAWKTRANVEWSGRPFKPGEKIPQPTLVANSIASWHM